MKFAENEARWRLLLKGLGSICPGKRFNPMQVAEKIIGDIETKDQRYVEYKAISRPARVETTGMNSFVDILQYYKKNYGQSKWYSHIWLKLSFLLNFNLKSLITLLNQTFLDQLLVCHHDIFELCQLQPGLGDFWRQIGKLVFDDETQLLNLDRKFIVLLCEQLYFMQVFFVFFEIKGYFDLACCLTFDLLELLATLRQLLQNSSVFRLYLEGQ